MHLAGCIRTLILWLHTVNDSWGPRAEGISLLPGIVTVAKWTGPDWDLVGSPVYRYRLNIATAGWAPFWTSTEGGGLEREAWCGIPVPDRGQEKQDGSSRSSSRAGRET